MPRSLPSPPPDGGAGDHRASRGHYQDAAVEAAFEFAQCMRDNGIEEFADPQIRADGDFFLSPPADVGDEELQVAEEACEHIAAMFRTGSDAAWTDLTSPRGGSGSCREVTGYVNGTAALDFVAATAPGASEVVVVGESAGSIAAPLYAGLVSDRLPDARITVLADTEEVDGKPFRGVTRLVEGEQVEDVHCTDCAGG